MKTLLLNAAGIAVLFTAALTSAQTTTTTTVTTDAAGGTTTTTQETVTTTSTGVITQYAPGSTFIVKESAGPVTYNYGSNVVYATRGGVILTPEQVQARVRVGVPVHVEYVPQGETRVIRRVLIDD